MQKRRCRWERACSRRALAAFAVLGGWALACSSSAGPGGDAGAEAGDANSLTDGAAATDAGDGGLQGDGGPDTGILYTPYACADAGWGSPFDRVESFVAADGTTVRIAVCGPRPGASTIHLSPPDAGSSASLFAAAALAAADAGAVTLALAPAEYDFGGADGGANWIVSGLSDVLIDGQGSTLVFHGLQAGLVVRNSHRVLFRNFAIDWGEPLAVAGALQPDAGACDGGMAFVVNSAYPIDAAAPLPIVSMSEFDVGRPGWPRAPFAQAHWAQTPSSQPTFAGNQTYCVGDPQALSAAPAGTAAIGIARTGGNAVYVVNASGDIAFENVTVYASPLEAFTFYGAGRGLRMSRCRVLRNPRDPTRLISSNADGVNFRQTLGNVLLEDSEFADQGDDGVNVLGLLFPLAPGSTPTSLVFDGASAANHVSAGDVLTVADRNLAVQGSATVTGVTKVLDGGVLTGATVSLAPPGIAAVADGGFIANVPASSSPDFLIRNVWVHDNDERAMLVQTANGLVDGFRATNNLGLFLIAQYGVFPEGPGAVNVIVQSSLFEGCGFMASPASTLSCTGPGSAAPAPISVMTLTPTTSNKNFLDGHPNANLILRNNVISGAPGAGILVAAATGVRVEGNLLLDTNQRAPSASCPGGTQIPAGSMVAMQASDVRFSGNARDGGTSLGLALDPTCAGCSGQPGY